MRKEALVLGTLVAWLAMSQAAPTFTLKWNVSAPSIWDGSPAVGDLDLDGFNDVVVGIQDAEGKKWMCAFSGPSGRQLWKYGPIRNYGTVIIDDINDDGMLEVVFVTWDAAAGEIIALNGPTGGLLWKHSGYCMKSEWSNTPAVADIDGDGRKEVIFAPRYESNVTAFDGRTGDIVWVSQAFSAHFNITPKNYKAPVSVTDMDGDGILEVIYYHTGPGWVLDGRNGELKWEMLNGGIADGTFIVTDVNNDGLKDLIVMGAYGVTCFYPDTTTLSANVTFLWQFEGRRTGYSNLAAADFDGDGILEIVHTEQSATGADPVLTWLLCTNIEDGSLLWNFTSLGKFAKLSPAIGDLDGDGLPDLLIGCEAPAGGFAYVLKGSTGEVLWNLTLPTVVRGIGCIADMDGDGRIDLVFHDAKNILCYGTFTPCPENYIAWGMQSRDPLNSGIFSVAQMPIMQMLGMLLLAIAERSYRSAAKGRDR